MQRLLMFGALLVILQGGVVSPSYAENEKIVVIGHTQITEQLSKEDVRQIFLGKRTRWDNESKIVFVIFNEKHTYSSFLKNYIQKTSSQYLNYWKKQVFTGKGRMPKSFHTSEELMAFLANTEGAISFARAEDVDSTVVKVIPVTYQ